MRKNVSPEKILEEINNTKALVDNSIKGLFRSIGDAGDSPSDETGYTILKQLNDIKYYTHYVHEPFHYPSAAETYTTTPLAASESYKGDSRDFAISRLGHMGIAAYSDVDGTIYIDGSIDGTNWDIVIGSQALTGGTGTSLVVDIPCRYARARYVNGAADQTVFRFGGRYFI